MIRQVDMVQNGFPVTVSKVVIIFCVNYTQLLTKTFLSVKEDRVRKVT